MTTTIPTNNPVAERARIYREAKKTGQRVTVRVFSTWVEVIYHPEPAHRINYLREFTDWLRSLQYGRPEWIPEYLKYSNKDYIRTCISKSGLDIKMVGEDNIAITRLPAAIRKQDGQVVLRIRDEVVVRFPCTRVCYLRGYERDIIDKRLAEAGLLLTFKDL